MFALVQHLWERIMGGFLCVVGVRMRRNKRRVGFYADMFLCLERRRTGVLEPCNTITAYSFEERMKARQGRIYQSDHPQAPRARYGWPR